MLHHKGTQPITTQRLVLRRFTVEDAQEAYAKWTSDDETQFWEPPHTCMAETERMIQEYVRQYDQMDWYMWAVMLENELIGLVCGNEINEAIKSICIGYCIAKPWWNQGIATEASRAMIAYFFDMDFNRVFSYHNPLNPASGKVMEKCGMTFEGRIRGGSMCNGDICDCLQYSRLRTDIVR